MSDKLDETSFGIQNRPIYRFMQSTELTTTDLRSYWRSYWRSYDDQKKKAV